MAKNWGRTPITNADKRGATQARYFVTTDDGPEERIDRRPQGKVERFVDKDGNIVSIVIYGDGDARKLETESRQRNAMHAKGCVEHSKCPLKHGTRYASEAARKDFAKMPAELQSECLSDPKVMERKDGDLWAKTGCKHIEWLIEYRREEAAKAYAKRNAHAAAALKAKTEAAELAQAQLELAREQARELKARKAKAAAAQGKGGE